MKPLKSESTRVAQAQAGADIYRETVNLLRDLAKNPIVEIILGVAVIEKMQREGIIGELWGTAIQGGIITVITAQQIAPLVPYMADAVKSLVPLAGTALIPK